VWIMSRRTERCNRDGRRLALEEVVEVEVDAVRGGEVDEKVIVQSGTQGPCWARMGAGVPSCETCTLSYARRDDSSSDKDENRGSNLADTSVLRYRGDEDATVEGLSWDAEPRARLEAAVARSRALRSTPSTILGPDGWLA
jgi:hypothetical protein